MRKRCVKDELAEGETPAFTVVELISSKEEIKEEYEEDPLSLERAHAGVRYPCDLCEYAATNSGNTKTVFTGIFGCSVIKTLRYLQNHKCKKGVYEPDDVYEDIAYSCDKCKDNIQ